MKNKQLLVKRAQKKGADKIARKLKRKKIIYARLVEKIRIKNVIKKFKETGMMKSGDLKPGGEEAGLTTVTGTGQ